MTEAIAASVALWLAGISLGRRFFHASGFAQSLLVGAVLGQTILVVSLQGLGHFGQLNRGNCWIVSGLAFLIALSVWKWKFTDASELPTEHMSYRVVVSLLAGLGGLISVRWLVAGLVLPVAPVSDGPIYHLPIAIRWSLTGALDRIATPFGEMAASYFPANGNLWMSWLFVMSGDEQLCKVSQWPFVFLIVLVLFGISRRLGGTRSGALIPGLLWSLTSIVGPTSALPIVDLPYTFWYLASVYFLLESQAADRRSFFGLAVLGGLSLGHALGTKSIAVATAPLVMLVGILLLRSRMSSLILFGVSMFLPMAYWYVRIVLETGNPIYPLHVSFGSQTIFSGWYDSTIMKQTSHYHVPPGDGILAQHVLGPIAPPMLWIIWGASVISGLVCLISRRHRAIGVVSILTMAYAVMYWWVIPYNTQQRFSLPALALGLVPLGCLPPRWVWLSVAALALVVFPALHPIPTAVYDLSALVAGVLFAGSLLVCRKPIRGFIALVACVGLSFCVYAQVQQMTSHQPRVVRFFPTQGFAARLLPHWLELHQASAHQPGVVAYAGTNLPFYLYGPDFRLRPRYVNVNAPADWLLHHYHRDRLTHGIHELADSAWPQWHRENPDFDRWIDNLRQLKVGWLFVARENFHGRKDAPARAPFPIEYRWALEHPNLFERIGSREPSPDPWAAVFRVRLPPGR